MGDDIIQANYDELEAVATCFGQWAESSAEMGSRVRQSAEKLMNGDWLGKGVEAFSKEMGDEVLPAVDRLTNALQQSQSVVNQIIFIIQQAEEEAARPFRDGHAYTPLNANMTNAQGFAMYTPAGGGTPGSQPAPPQTPARQLLFPGSTRNAWANRALAAAGIDPTKWRPEQGFMANREIIQKVYNYYGQLFREHPELLWAGMARVGGQQVFYPGFFQVYALKRGADAAAGRWISSSFLSVGSKLAALSLGFLQTKLLSMQREIFTDLAWQHEAYRQGGIEQMRDLAANGQLDRGMLSAWEDIASGDRTRIERGNTDLLHREQYQIIQNDYDEISRGLYGLDGVVIRKGLSYMAKPPIPGGRGFDEVVPGGDITNFNDRWRWIQNDMLPRWLQINRTDPARAQRLAREPLRAI